MPTSKRPTSGRGQSDDISKLDSYNKASKTAALGRFMRTFSRSKTSRSMTAWDDSAFLTAVLAGFKFVGDDTSAVDSATVPSAQFTNLWNILWETHFENANLKDLVAAEETAWILYYSAMLQICMDIQLQYNFRTLLPAYTESDTVPTDNTELSYLTQSSFDIFVGSMSEYPVPKGVYELVDLFGTWVVQMSQAYEKYSLAIPPSYVVPFASLYDLADLEAMRGLLRVNLGNMTTHAKKFGLKTGAWRDPIKPVVKAIDDPDVIAYLNHMWFIFYDNTPGNQLVQPNGGFAGDNLVGDYNDVEYFFKDNPNESPMHVLAPWFGVYNATNNPYGGFILLCVPNTAEYYINMSSVAQHGVGMGPTVMTSDNVKEILPLFKAATDSEDAIFSPAFAGTNFTANQNMGDSWPLAGILKLFHGSGRGATETNNDLINYLGRSLK